MEIVEAGNQECSPSGFFRREVRLRAPVEWSPRKARRTWKLGAPAYGPNDVPAASRKTQNGYLVRTRDSLARVGRKFEVSSADLCHYFASRAAGGFFGALATHIDDVLGCVGPDVLQKAREYLGRHFVHVGMKLPQDDAFSARLDQENFTDAPEPMPTASGSRASHQRLSTVVGGGSDVSM